MRKYGKSAKTHCLTVLDQVLVLYFQLGPDLKAEQFLVFYTVQSRFSDTLFSDKSRFSDNFAEDHFLVHKNILFSNNLVLSVPSL